jgi:hypothetical protein
VQDPEAGEPLSQPYGIFKIQQDGNALWIEAAEDLEAAKARARVLAEHFPGRYLIVDIATGETVTIP